MEIEELKKLEEDLPRLQESDLVKAARTYKAKTGAGCDGFHLKVLQDMAKETRVSVVEFLEKVKQSGKWPQHACTTNVLLNPEECCERDLDLVGNQHAHEP